GSLLGEGLCLDAPAVPPEHPTGEVEKSAASGAGGNELQGEAVGRSGVDLLSYASGKAVQQIPLPLRVLDIGDLAQGIRQTLVLLRRHGTPPGVLPRVALWEGTLVLCGLEGFGAHSSTHSSRGLAVSLTR